MKTPINQITELINLEGYAPKELKEFTGGILEFAKKYRYLTEEIDYYGREKSDIVDVNSSLTIEIKKNIIIAAIKI